jgi:hypothetical protein
MLATCEFFLGEPREIVLAGEKGAPDTDALARTVHGHFGPGRILLLVDSDETRAFLAAGNPAIQSMSKLEGRAAAYVCSGYACKLPVAEAGALAELIQ